MPVAGTMASTLGRKLPAHNVHKPGAADGIQRLSTGWCVVRSTNFQTSPPTVDIGTATIARRLLHRIDWSGWQRGKRVGEDLHTRCFPFLGFGRFIFVRPRDLKIEP